MRPLQPVSINGVEFDALIEGGEEYTANVPSYPVDNGYSVSDNAALDPLKLHMTLYLTPTPVTWLGRHEADINRVNRVCDDLIRVFEERMPIPVYTQEKTYENMVISQIAIKKSPDEGYSREIEVILVQVVITTAETEVVPAEYARSGKSGANAGNGVTNGVNPNGYDSGSGSDPDFGETYGLSDVAEVLGISNWDSNASWAYNLCNNAGLLNAMGLSGYDGVTEQPKTYATSPSGNKVGRQRQINGAEAYVNSQIP